MNRKEIITFLLLILVALFLSGCGTSTSPTPVILASTYFTGCAFFDRNGNRLIDDEDTSIVGMNFTVTLSDGTGFGDITSVDDGCATTIIPMMLPRDAWPVVAQMTAPSAAGYTPIGDTRVTLDYPDTKVDFLFSQP